MRPSCGLRAGRAATAAEEGSARGRRAPSGEPRPVETHLVHCLRALITWSREDTSEHIGHPHWSVGNGMTPMAWPMAYVALRPRIL